MKASYLRVHGTALTPRLMLTTGHRLPQVVQFGLYNPSYNQNLQARVLGYSFKGLSVCGLMMLLGNYPETLYGQGLLLYGSPVTILQDRHPVLGWLI